MFFFLDTKKSFFFIYNKFAVYLVTIESLNAYMYKSIFPGKMLFMIFLWFLMIFSLIPTYRFDIIYILNNRYLALTNNLECKLHSHIVNVCS